MFRVTKYVKNSIPPFKLLRALNHSNAPRNAIAYISHLTATNCLNLLQNCELRKGDTRHYVDLLYRLKDIGDEKCRKDAFELLMYRIYRENTSYQDAVDLMNLLESEGLVPSKKVFSMFVTILVNQEGEEPFLHLKRFYSKYHEICKMNNAALYVDVCRTYCKFGDGAALEVLADMVKASYQPTAQVVEELLNHALHYREARLVRGLVAWFLSTQNQSNTKLTFGLCLEILQLSASLGDEELASSAIELLTKNGYPLRAEIYYGLIKAFAAAGNLTAAVEAVLDMHEQGILFGSSGPSHEEALKDIRVFLVNLLLRKGRSFDENHNEEHLIQDQIQMLENVYFALSEQAKEGASIPPVLLEAWIESVSSLGFFEKGLEVISQIDSNFQLPPTVNFYNALLRGTAFADNSQILDLIPFFFEELEKLQKLHPDAPEYQANQDSYTIVFDSMLAHRKLLPLSEIWQVCKSKNIFPRRPTLRKVANAFLSEKRTKEAQEMLQLIR